MDKLVGAVILCTFCLFCAGASCGKALVADVKSCAKSTLSEAQQASWEQLRPAADAALKQEWNVAKVELLALGEHYGLALLDCIVTDIANGITPPPAAPGAARIEDRRTVNARAWLSRAAP